MKEFYPEGWIEYTTENKRNRLTPSALELCRQNETVLEATALKCDERHNLTVDLGCMLGVIPREEGAVGIAEGTTRDIALISRVGHPVCFVVSEIRTDENGRMYALLSRRRAQELCRAELFSGCGVGSVIDARVTHLENFGAFCDIGCGIVALLPIDAISVSRISHPADRFRVGDDIRAVIRSVSPDGKITLTHKELLGTWEENASLFSAGQTVTGTVRSVESYGVFVELTPNLAGLAEPRPGAAVGQCAGVYIKSILPEKMKIKLLIIDSFDAPPNRELRYFHTGKTVKTWTYSPPGCEKRIETRFTD